MPDSFDLAAALLRLSVPLPGGRLIHGDEGDDDTPSMWVSDAPSTPQVWRSLYAEHSRSGLYPLLLDHLHGEPRRPWDDGEIWPDMMSSPDNHDAGDVLAQWWAANATEAVTEPYGLRWPGLADPTRPADDPVQRAEELAEQMLRKDPGLRLGLVRAGQGSDTLSACGWQGAVNHENDAAMLSAVLRSWEHRFGARVVALGFADLYLSVAAPPTDDNQALRIAAEHFAFCADNIWQGVTPLARYATTLVNAPAWHFWWD